MICSYYRFGFVIILMCIIKLFALSGCSTYGYNDSFLGKDKLYHFTASGIIGAGTTMAVNSNGASDRDAPLIGISVALSVGAGKEYYDTNVKGTFWSWKDMCWNLIGGATGSYLIAQ
ncbi:DUF2279 domain-containing protein [Candidatus Latescibacterota bacterium]